VKLEEEPKEPTEPQEETIDMVSSFHQSKEKHIRLGQEENEEKQRNAEIKK
jgi:hypothetical protein